MPIQDVDLDPEHLTLIVALVAQQQLVEAWEVHVVKELGTWSLPLIGLMLAKAGDHLQQATTMWARELVAMQKRRL